MRGKNNVGKREAEGERERKRNIEKCERQHIAKKGFGVAYKFYRGSNFEELNNG
jgi:hypothetical protein